jgi:hypothetical protein
MYISTVSYLFYFYYLTKYKLTLVTGGYQVIFITHQYFQSIGNKHNCSWLLLYFEWIELILSIGNKDNCFCLSLTFTEISQLLGVTLRWYRILCFFHFLGVTLRWCWIFCFRLNRFCSFIFLAYYYSSLQNNPSYNYILNLTITVYYISYNTINYLYFSFISFDFLLLWLIFLIRYILHESLYLYFL